MSKPWAGAAALARRALEYYITHGKVSEAASTLVRRGRDEWAGAARGVFVTLLKKNGDLRGCIGTVGGTQKTLGDEIMQNAAAAAFSDPRFPPLKAEELLKITITVDILEEPEAAAIDDLDPAVYGIVVTAGEGAARKRGLLLPALPGVKDAHTQVMLALRKGGIKEDEAFSIERFRVTRIEE